MYNVNYKDSIVNLSNSILKEFNVETKNSTLPDIDKILSKKFRNVVVILYDGMGFNLLNRILDKDSFLIKNCLRSYSSVIPSTTTASTTSMLSGMYPNEHGWLGWDLYFSMEDKIVTMFRNTIKDTDIEAGRESLAYKYYGYKNLEELIKEQNINAKILFPFGNDPYSDINDMNKRILEETKKEGRNFVYAYYTDPDSTMHETGTDSIETKNVFELINKSTEELAGKLEDTLLIVTADHGHINSDMIMLSKYPDITDMLSHDISIEPRLTSFMVKDDKKEEFVKLFNKYFGKDFDLKTKEEVLKDKLFGIGENHKYFESSVGDFIALAKTNKYFITDENSLTAVSLHAGLTDDEMRIPLIVIEK